LGELNQQEPLAEKIKERRLKSGFEYFCHRKQQLQN